MRGFAWTVLLIIAFLGASARAQTYSPAFPVCIQTYDIGGGNIECSFTSWDACRASASGRAAQCITNPYFAPTSPRRKRGPY
jgi:hypothetical protein